MNTASDGVQDKTSMNKGIAVGAVGALVAAAVIGGASWFAFSRGESSVEQTNRMGTPTTVIGDSTSTPTTAVPVSPPAQNTAPALPAPVYQQSAPPVAQAAPPARTAPVREPVRVAQGRAGTVAAVREVNVKGEANGVGAALGGVVGGLLGHELGGGSGRTALTIAGAVGGGLAGHETQKRINGSKVYNVTVRFDDGTTETLSEGASRTWREGDRVRVHNGVISSDNA